VTDKGSIRPTVFALSNPKTQAEVTSENAIKWSEGKVIYGCGTAFAGATFNGRTHMPGQVGARAPDTAWTARPAASLPVRRITG